MKKEFNLSEKIKDMDLSNDPDIYNYGLNVEDVKEFIRLLKEEVRLTPNRDDKVKATLLLTDMGGIGKAELYKIIDKLAGEKLK